MLSSMAASIDTSGVQTVGELAADLRTELRTVRKGRGLEAARIADQVGDNLRRACGVLPGDADEVVRRKVARRLDELADTLPADLGLAVTVALGLHPAARQPFLGDRVNWLADQIGRDARTARRRVDDGLDRLAGLAAGNAPPAVAVPLPRPPRSISDRWHVRAFHAVVRLDGSSPEAIERREVVAQEDGLDRIDAVVSLPRDPAARQRPQDLGVDVLYGATVLRREHDSDSRFRFELLLPEPLRAGERHEYGLHFRVPAGQAMRSHYVFVSRYPCDLFDLRVRFDRRRPPERAWRVTEAFHRVQDESGPAGDPVSPDRAGDLHLTFDHLRPGFGYGVQWRDGTSYELGTLAG